MKIILTGRQGGKTTSLIRMCSEDGGNIVCQSEMQSRFLIKQAEVMGLKISKPITYAEFISGNFDKENIKYLYIDEADLLLQYMAEIEIKAITMSS